jgi:hypothetical protein
VSDMQVPWTALTGLSDEGLEDPLYDSQAMREFVGADLAWESPHIELGRANQRRFVVL